MGPSQYAIESRRPTGTQTVCPKFENCHWPNRVGIFAVHMTLEVNWDSFAEGRRMKVLLQTRVLNPRCEQQLSYNVDARAV